MNFSFKNLSADQRWKTLKVSPNVILLIFISLMVACSNTEFQGKSSEKNDAKRPGLNGEPGEGGPGDSTPGSNGENEGEKGVPAGVTETLEKEGFIDPTSYTDLESIFKDDLINLGDGSENGKGGSGKGGSGKGGSGNEGTTDSTGVFTDPNGAFQTDKGNAYLYWRPCDKELGVTKSTTGFSGPEGSYIRASGSFCPRGSGVLTVLFMIDFSGSMHGGGGLPGNDVPAQDTCGRLKATTEIIKKILAGAPEGSDIKVGISSFANTAAQIRPFAAAKDVVGQLNAATICQSDKVGATNYQAAFQLAEQQLSSIEGNRVLYFISDGAPTRDNQGVDQSQTRDRAKKAGLDAATSFQANVKGVTSEIIYLGHKTEASSEAYLKQIAGDKGKVTLVANAEELGAAAAKIEAPEIGIKKDKISAKVKYADGTSKSVSIEKTKSDKKFGTVFITKPFLLKADSGKAGKNILVVEAETDDGEKLSSEIEVKFSPSAKE